MQKMSTVKNACICAICIALCYVLPIAFHSLGLGSVFSPLHIPVLLCGLICGGFYGGFCGIAGPVLSSVLSGMPPAMALVTMLPELVVYGVASGVLMNRLRTGKLCSDVYICLGSAMLLGRVTGGIAKALFAAYLGGGEAFGIGLWVSSYFVGSFPGIVAHLVLIPILVTTLMKAGIIPRRYAERSI